MTPEEKRSRVWQTVTGRAETGPRIDPQYRAKWVGTGAIDQSEHFETRRDAHITRAIEENLKDCTLIGPDQGYILRCMVYGFGF